MLKPIAAHIKCFPAHTMHMAGPVGPSCQDRISQNLPWYYYLESYRAARSGFGQQPVLTAYPPEVCRVQGLN